jgi:cellulose 1,4-beta-cellobiosidase
VALVVLVPLTACAADAGDPLKTMPGAGSGAFVAPDAGTGTGGDNLGVDDSSTAVAADEPNVTPTPSDDGSSSDEGRTEDATMSLDAVGPSDASTSPIPPDVQSCPTCAIELKYMTSTTTATTQDIRPHYEIDNNGTSPQSLTELTVRYYFTADGSAQQAFACDYAAIGCGLIQATFAAITPATTTADHYFELSFTGGTIPAGGSSGEIQVRFHDSNYQGMFTQTNDYSFGAGATQYADWNDVTVYRNGTLVWGVEPQ